MGWVKIRAIHRAGGRLIRSAEFAIVASFAAGGWAAGSDLTLALPLLALGLALGLLCITSAQLSVRSKIMGSAFLALSFVAEAVFLYHHSRPDASQHTEPANLGRSLDNTVLLKCRYTAFPESVPEMGVDELEITDDGLQEHPQFPPHTDGVWGTPDQPLAIYECDFSNLGSASLPSVQAELTLEIRKPAKQRGTTRPGNVVRSIKWRSPSTALAAHERNSKTFYVWNHSKNWISATLPRSARVSVVGSEKEWIVELAAPPADRFDLGPFISSGERTPQLQKAHHRHTKASEPQRNGAPLPPVNKCNVGGNAVITGSVTQDCSTHIGSP
jgi:hypothetical protein